MEAEAPPKRGRSKVTVDPEPEIQPIPPRPRSRAKKEMPGPVAEQEAPKKRVRKKPEPGSVPPKQVNFTSARGAVNFTAHKSEPLPPVRMSYEHLHGPNRFSHIMSAW